MGLIMQTIFYPYKVTIMIQQSWFTDHRTAEDALAPQIIISFVIPNFPDMKPIFPTISEQIIWYSNQSKDRSVQMLQLGHSSGNKSYFSIHQHIADSYIS